MGYVVPRMWVGETVAVLASGPSMSQVVADKVRAAGLHAVVVNDTYRLAPWADILYAADRRWWEANPEAATEFAGIKLVGQSGVHLPGVQVMMNSGTNGFDPNPRFVRHGNNSGHAAIHVAIHTGAARILLCGFDMHDRDGLHWFGLHTRKSNDGKILRNPAHNSFRTWLKRASDLAAGGAEILNCTPGSALRCFRFADLDSVLEGSQ